MLIALVDQNQELDYMPVTNDEAFVSFGEFAWHYLHNRDLAGETLEFYLLEPGETIRSKSEKATLAYKWNGLTWSAREDGAYPDASSKDLAFLCIENLLQAAGEN